MRRRLATCLLSSALMLTAATSAFALTPYPPDGPPGGLPRTDPEVTLTCSVTTEGEVRCQTDGYKAGSNVAFDVASPASASVFGVVPVALPQDYVVLATGTRVSNGELVAKLGFPYPCALSDVTLAVRSSGLDQLDQHVVLEQAVSTTPGVCVEGITLERLRAIIAGGAEPDLPLSRTGADLLELLLIATLALSLGGLLISHRRNQSDATVAR